MKYRKYYIYLLFSATWTQIILLSENIISFGEGGGGGSVFRGNHKIIKDFKILKKKNKIKNKNKNKNNKKERQKLNTI